MDDLGPYCLQLDIGNQSTPLFNINLSGVHLNICNRRRPLDIKSA